MRPKIEWFKHEDGTFDYNYVSRNGSDTLVTSHQGYENFDDMLRAAAEVTNCHFAYDQDNQRTHMGMSVKYLGDSMHDIGGTKRIDVVPRDPQ